MTTSNNQPYDVPIQELCDLVECELRLLAAVRRVARPDLTAGSPAWIAVRQTVHTCIEYTEEVASGRAPVADASDDVVLMLVSRAKEEAAVRLAVHDLPLPDLNSLDFEEAAEMATLVVWRFLNQRLA